MNMDEKGFKTSLQNSLKYRTIRNYIISVKKFEEWLFEYRKKLGEAGKGDFKRYAMHLLDEKKAIGTVHTYFFGIERYYRWWRKEEKAKAIEEIRRELPRPQQRPYLLSWNDFKYMVDKTKENGVPKEKRVLLNLLWSEMTPREIVGLHKSDIDFKKRLISIPGGKTYRVTQQAWDALQEFVPNRGDKIFTRGIRSLEMLSKKFMTQTPKQLRKSCERDLLDTGKKVRFVYESDKTTSLKEEEKAYPKGHAYAFYKDIRDITKNAKNEIFVIDAYVDEELLNLYLEKIPIGVKIRILTKKPQGNFVTVAQKFKIKPKVDFEVRRSNDCHDRLFFIDDKCWVMGQSVRHAGRKPTYLVKIEGYNLFRKVFDDLWKNASPLI